MAGDVYSPIRKIVKKGNGGTITVTVFTTRTRGPGSIPVEFRKTAEGDTEEEACNKAMEKLKADPHYTRTPPS